MSVLFNCMSVRLSNFDLFYPFVCFVRLVLIYVWVVLLLTVLSYFIPFVCFVLFYMSCFTCPVLNVLFYIPIVHVFCPFFPVCTSFFLNFKMLKSYYKTIYNTMSFIVYIIILSTMSNTNIKHC